ncbi:hypothetical protein EV175_006474, partial [Coemansia sp. RSA 1933]
MGGGDGGGLSNSSANASPGQSYPISQPGLPPAGPASAYVTSNRSPLIARARGRRMPHNTYEYSDANAADTYSLGSSPASGVGASLPPSMRHTRSAESPVDSGSSRQDASDAVRRQPSSELSFSFQGSVNSEAGTQDNVRLAGFTGGIGDGQAPRTASTYNYPEMGYRPASAARDSQMYGSQHELNPNQMEMAVDQVGDGYSDGQNLAGNSLQGQHGQDYPSAVGSMTHIRWNPASKGSPLRMELGPTEAASAVPSVDGPLNMLEGAMIQPLLSTGSAKISARASANTSAPSSMSTTQNLKHQQQVSQIYATLPRSGYQTQQGSSEPIYLRAQIPADMTAANVPNGTLNASWSQLSPRIGGDQGGHSNQQQQQQYTVKSQPDSVRRNSVYSFNTSDAHPGQNQGSGRSVGDSNKQTPNILRDYYSISSPGDQPF